MRTAFPCAIAAAWAVWVAAQVPAPIFRARTDVMLLDVTVMAGREPVRGLAPGDFTVTLDGRPVPVSVFEEVSVAPPTPTSTVTRSLLPDVVSNRLDTKRVVVIFIDDFSLLVSGEASARTIQETREIARRIARGLGVDDLSAVLFSFGTHRTQTLTTSTPLLLEAIDRAALFTVSAEAGGGADPESLAKRGDCYCGLCSYSALRQVAESLQSLSGLRKTVMYIGAGFYMTLPPDRVCYPQQAEALEAAFAATKRANVTIHAFDPRGLKAIPARGFVNPDLSVSQSFFDERLDPRVQFLRNLAERTGGQAVVNTNDPVERVDGVLAEGRSYYVIGVVPPAEANGRPPRVDVRVNRRGTNVRVRSGMAPPEPEPVVEPGVPGTAATRAALEAITRPLLPRATVPLEVTASPFAGADGRPVVALALGVPEVGAAAQPGQPVDLFVRALDHRGQDVATRLEHLTLPAATAAAGRRYAFQALMPLAPGRYELRVAVASDAFGAGSVYTHVDVPDFRNEPVSASGLVLIDGSSASAGDAVPVFPLTRRTFARAHRVSGFVRTYRRAGNRDPAPAATLQVTDMAGKIVLRATTTSRPAVLALSSDISALDYEFPLPLDALGAGTYLLILDVKIGSQSIRRFLGFGVE